jgi:hypothetical protein
MNFEYCRILCTTIGFKTNKAFFIFKAQWKLMVYDKLIYLSTNMFNKFKLVSFYKTRLEPSANHDVNFSG